MGRVLWGGAWAEEAFMRFVKASALALAGLLAGGAAVWADPIDDAAAKQRGVSVEVIQLENARTKIAEMEKRIATLQKENATLKEALVKAQNTPAAATAPSRPEVATRPAGLPTAHDPTNDPAPRGRTVKRVGPALPPPTGPAR
jgi:uncharacterized small protein (DUF1192 family)